MADLTYLDQLRDEILDGLCTGGGHVCQDKSPHPPVRESHLQSNLVMDRLAILGVSKRVYGKAPTGQGTLVWREPAGGRGKIGQGKEGSHGHEAGARALHNASTC